MRTGKSGYQPACTNEWVRGVCEKPRVKCSECPVRAFPPVSAEVIRWHLTGKDNSGKACVIGVYPMLLDETCYFLAVDFDKTDWQVDAGAYLQTCKQIGVPAVLERSRSGNGGHIWIFFSEAVPATLARKLGSLLITETMERHPDIGLNSYDRFFPNQDTLPKGGFGNLIALPLQQTPRTHGHSVFIDNTFSPHPDQWAFLDSIIKVSLSQLEHWVNTAEENGKILGVKTVTLDDDDPNAKAPWKNRPSRRSKELLIDSPLPEKLDIVLADQIYISKENLPPALRNQLIRLAAFQNPEFYRAQAMRIPTYDKPRIIDCSENFAQHLAIPRGCRDDLYHLLRAIHVKRKVQDKRNKGEKLECQFHGTLRPDQQKAADAMMAHDIGVLAATTAFGKTVLAAWMIAQRGVNTLVLVHRKQLQEQWVERLSQFLGIPTKEIGRLGGGRKKLSGKLDIALIQSLVRKGEVHDCVADYGHIIVDECHHLSARSFELAVRRAKAQFVLGLSATVIRKDGHHPIIFMQCGPVRHRVNAKDQAAQRPFQHHVIVRPTAFRSSGETDDDIRIEFQRLYKELIDSESRNHLICSDVHKALLQGRTPLIITERTDHLTTLASALHDSPAEIITLQGGMGKKALTLALETLKKTATEKSPIILIATGKFIGEGFDDSRFDTLFLTLPVSWKGTIAQYVGRLHRLHDGKKEVHVYDYADLDVPMLSRMFDRRCKGYEAVGYTILLPGNALPGWPQSVPLTVNPQWKQQYSSSIQRLIADGLDENLATLFVGASQASSTIDTHNQHFSPEANAKGIDRARSASEAFFYHRLQTLPETKDRFKLNANLPIPFNQQGFMEVDFLFTGIRLVIEIDGRQHLADANAYRSDRRKDALLQENGYFILRFLATDLGKSIASILDQILRTLSHLEKLTPPEK